MAVSNVKVALVGCGAAGKTSIASRLATGAFIDTLMTVGFDVETWSFSCEEEESVIKASLFDFGGQEQFRFFQGSMMLGAAAVLLCVDVTRFMSLLELDEWLPLIEHVPKSKWILVANKIDEGGIVSEEVVREKAEELGVPYLLVSAKTGENFDRLIKHLKGILSP